MACPADSHSSTARPGMQETTRWAADLRPGDGVELFSTGDQTWVAGKVVAPVWQRMVTVEFQSGDSRCRKHFAFDSEQLRPMPKQHPPAAPEDVSRSSTSLLPCICILGKTVESSDSPSAEIVDFPDEHGVQRKYAVDGSERYESIELSREPHQLTINVLDKDVKFKIPENVGVSTRGMAGCPEDRVHAEVVKELKHAKSDETASFGSKKADSGESACLLRVTTEIHCARFSLLDDSQATSSHVTDVYAGVKRRVLVTVQGVEEIYGDDFAHRAHLPKRVSFPVPWDTPVPLPLKRNTVISVQEEFGMLPRRIRNMVGKPFEYVVEELRYQARLEVFKPEAWSVMMIRCKKPSPLDEKLSGSYAAECAEQQEGEEGKEEQEKEKEDKQDRDKQGGEDDEEMKKTKKQEEPSTASDWSDSGRAAAH